MGRDQLASGPLQAAPDANVGMDFSAAVREVTDRKRAEEKFRGVLEAATDAIVGVNAGDPDLTGLRVVAVTAYAMVGERDLAIAAGFDGYLSKPIEPSSFVRTIDSYLPVALRGHEATAQWPADTCLIITDTVVATTNRDEGDKGDEAP